MVLPGEESIYFAFYCPLCVCLPLLYVLVTVTANVSPSALCELRFRENHSSENGVAFY